MSRTGERHHGLRSSSRSGRSRARLDLQRTAVDDADRAPGLRDRTPSKRKRGPLAGASRLILNSTGEHRRVGRHQRESRVAAGRVERSAPTMPRVQEAVLLRERLAGARITQHDAPGRDARRVGRRACCIAAWRANESRTRCSNAASGGGGRLGRASSRLHRMRLAAPARGARRLCRLGQQPRAARLVLGDLGQRDLDVLELLLELAAMLAAARCRNAFSCCAVSAFESYMSTSCFTSGRLRPSRLPRSVSFSRVRSRCV